MQISFAARAILNKLNENLSNFNFLFAAFYDIERGFEPYFKRRLAQVPMEQRGKDWISIMWSRDPQTQSWNNRQYTVTLNSSSLYAETTDVRYVYCSIVFTYISNSMSYLEKCEKNFFRYIPDGFSVYFDNTPYSEWHAKQTVKYGAIRQSRIYNGWLYKCTKAGVTGGTEPTWKTSGTITDGTAEWTPMEPTQLKVQLDNVAYSGLQKLDLDGNDSICKLDFGGRMFLPLLLGGMNSDGDDGYIVDPNDPNNNVYPRILYPRDDISFNKKGYPDYDHYITPTPEYWRNKLGS